MTGQDVFDAALCLMADDAPEDYRSYVLPLLNILLAETMDVNNGLRRWAGKEPLTEAPQLTALDDEIPYEPLLLRMAFPPGLAAKLLFDDGDMNKMAYMQNQYAEGVNACVRGVAVPILDVYGGSGE